MHSKALQVSITMQHCGIPSGNITNALILNKYMFNTPKIKEKQLSLADSSLDAVKK
jgi:hypothetical protein